MRCATRFVAALAAVAVVGYASAASAAQYQINTALSSITVTGNVIGFIPIVAQTPGSNVVSFNGTIDANVGGGNITFTGAAADANLQPNPQAPAIGGGAGTAPADAGLAIGPGLGTIALRDFLISVNSGATPLTGGTTFALNALTLNIAGGSIDYNVPSFSLVGSQSIVGESAQPTSGNGTLIAGVLTLPVNVSLTFEVSPGQNATVNLLGQIVATEVVPEPATLAMLGMGVVGLVAVGRRRFRKA